MLACIQESAGTIVSAAHTAKTEGSLLNAIPASVPVLGRCLAGRYSCFLDSPVNVSTSFVEIAAMFNLRLLPRETHFFDLFESSAFNMVESAQRLLEML